MADQKLSALTELATTPANDDEVYIRDVSEAAAAESKRITTANLIEAKAVAAVEAAGLALAAAKKIILANDGVIELGTTEGRLKQWGEIDGTLSYAKFQPTGGDFRAAVELRPSGTQVITYYILTNGSDPANSSSIYFEVASDTAYIETDTTGGGTPITSLEMRVPIQLVENKPIRLDVSLGSDGDYSGITEVGTAGAILAFGNLVYLDGVTGNNKWEKTDADAEATAFGKIGICVLAAAENAATEVLIYGNARAGAAT